MCKVILLAIATVLSSPSAYACAAWANGLTASNLKPLLENIESRLKEENKGKLPRDIKAVLWENISTSVGAMGDCQAVTIRAKVHLMSNDTNECKLTMDLIFVDSDRIPYYQQSNESLECLTF